MNVEKLDFTALLNGLTSIVFVFAEQIEWSITFIDKKLVYCLTKKNIKIA